VRTEEALVPLRVPVAPERKRPCRLLERTVPPAAGRAARARSLSWVWRSVPARVRASIRRS